MTGLDVRRLDLTALTHGSWQPFGALPSQEATEHDTADLEFEWGDGHLNFIGHRRDEVPASAASVRCEMLFRHRTHTQALMSMDADTVVVVAPPGTEFSASADFVSVRAFALPALTPVLLHRGTWHWGPFPVRDPSVRLLNVQGRRYPEDNECVRLATDHAVVYDVDLGALSR
jgi:ureidoglycolate hydrolase